MKKLQQIAVIPAMLLLLVQSVLGVTSYFSAESVPDGGQMAGQAPDMQMNGRAEILQVQTLHKVQIAALVKRKLLQTVMLQGLTQVKVGICLQ